MHFLYLGGSTSDRLKEVYKPVLTDTDCLLNVGGTFNSTTMLCAGFVQGGEGTCTVMLISFSRFLYLIT